MKTFKKVTTKELTAVVNYVENKTIVYQYIFT